MTGFVAVIGVVDLRSVSLKEPCLLTCERRTERCYGIVYTALVKGDDVHISFDHYNVVELPALQKINGIDVLSLIIDGGVAGIDVLRFIAAHGPPAESDHLPVCVYHGEHQSPAEEVVYAGGILSSRHGEAGFQYDFA